MDFLFQFRLWFWIIRRRSGWRRQKRVEETLNFCFPRRIAGIKITHSSSTEKKKFHEKTNSETMSGKKNLFAHSTSDENNVFLTETIITEICCLQYEERYSVGGTTILWLIGLNMEKWVGSTCTCRCFVTFNFDRFGLFKFNCFERVIHFLRFHLDWSRLKCFVEQVSDFTCIELVQR